MHRTLYTNWWIKLWKEMTCSRTPIVCTLLLNVSHLACIELCCSWMELNTHAQLCHRGLGQNMHRMCSFLTFQLSTVYGVGYKNTIHTARIPNKRFKTIRIEWKRYSMKGCLYWISVSEFNWTKCYQIKLDWINFIYECTNQ